MSGQPTPPMLTYAQIAAMVGRSVSTVERWVREGHIPFHKIGHNIRFDPAEIRRWLEENEIDRDNRIQPVRPLKKKGGTQNVWPSQTLGDTEHCWCGDLIDHEWPGKDKGAPHPHDHEGMQQVVVVEQQSDDGRIGKGDLRGYHATLKSFLIQCINHDGLAWRVQQNSILLYPPDGTQPVTVHCRNNDGQMRSLKQWYAAHVEGVKVEPGEVGEAVVAQLAEQINDPKEHPVRNPEPEWHPYLYGDGEVSDWFESDGTSVRCKVCVGTDTEYVTPVSEVRGLGGHVRMTHRPTESLRSPEALAKSVDSRRYNRLHEKVLVAVELLAETVGFTSDDTRIAGLEREIDRLKGELRTERMRADEAEARLKLMQEAFKGLD